MNIDKVSNKISRFPLLPVIVALSFMNTLVTFALASLSQKAAIFANLLGVVFATAFLMLLLMVKRNKINVNPKLQILSIFSVFLFSISGAVISLNFRNPGAGLVWLLAAFVLVSALLLSEKNGLIYFSLALALPILALVPLISSVLSVGGISKFFIVVFLLTTLATLVIHVFKSNATMSNLVKDDTLSPFVFKSTTIDSTLSLLGVVLIILTAILSATTKESFRIAFLAILLLVSLFSLVAGSKSYRFIATPVISLVLAASLLLSVFAVPTGPVISQSEDSTIAAAMLELPLPTAPKESLMTGRTADILPGSGGAKEEFRNFTFDDCDKLGRANRDCFITYFVELAENSSVSKAVDTLVSKLSKREGKTFQPNCHEVTHSLGRMAALTKGMPLGKALALDPMVCSSGFTHGIWEELISQMKPGELEAQADTFCLAKGQTSEFGEWACTHILGHNLVLRHFTNPEEGAIYCAKLEGGQGKLDCLAGAWMEYWVADTVTRYYKALGSVSKPFEICARADADIAAGCYLEIFPTIAAIVGYDYRKVFSACESYAPGEYLRWCALGAGRGASVISLYERERLESLCKTITSKYMRDMCFLAGLTQITMATGVVDENLKSCNLIENEDRREACRKWIYGNRQTLDSGPNPVVEIDTSKPTASGSAIDRVPNDLSEKIK